MKRKKAHNKKEAKPPIKKYFCCVSGKEIPKERVKFLMTTSLPEENWTVVEHASVQKIKGIYMGEAGTSELRLVTKIYDDSVRGIFRKTELEEDNEKDDDSHNFIEEGK